MKPRRALFASLLTLSLFVLSGAALADSHYTLLVHFIDVGQGDAVLIQLKGKNILYDCGDTGKGKDVLEYLREQDVRELDLIVASHAHKDHIGGCIYLLQKMKVKAVYDNGSPSKPGPTRSSRPWPGRRPPTGASPRTSGKGTWSSTSPTTPGRSSRKPTGASC